MQNDKPVPYLVYVGLHAMAELKHICTENVTDAELLEADEVKDGIEILIDGIWQAFTTVLDINAKLYINQDDQKNYGLTRDDIGRRNEQEPDILSSSHAKDVKPLTERDPLLITYKRVMGFLQELQEEEPESTRPKPGGVQSPFSESYRALLRIVGESFGLTTDQASDFAASYGFDSGGFFVPPSTSILTVYISPIVQGLAKKVKDYNTSGKAGNVIVPSSQRALNFMLIYEGILPPTKYIDNLAFPFGLFFITK